MTDLSAAFAGIKEAQTETPAAKPGRAPRAMKQPKSEQIELEDITGKPMQPKRAAAPKVEKAKAWTHGSGKSSQEGYERLTVYVRKETKDDLVRSLVGTGRDMSDLVQQLLDSHLGS